MREHLLFELDKYNKKRLSMEEEIEKIISEMGYKNVKITTSPAF